MTNRYTIQYTEPMITTKHPSIKLKCSSMYDNLVYNIKNYMLSLEKWIFLLYFCHLSAMKSIVVWYGGCWGILCLFFVLTFNSCKSLFCWRQHETMRLRVPTCKAITLFWRGSIEMVNPYLKSTEGMSYAHTFSLHFIASFR